MYIGEDGKEMRRKGKEKGKRIRERQGIKERRGRIGGEERKEGREEKGKILGRGNCCM